MARTRHREVKNSGPSIRVHQAAADRTRTTVFEVPELRRVPKAFVGFVDFIRTQGVVGLGVGFVVGTAANTLIKSVVTNILNPVIGLLTGGINLAQKTVCLNSTNGVCKNVMNYGQVISDLITFVAILFVVYIVIKSLKLDKLDKKKE